MLKILDNIKKGLYNKVIRPVYDYFTGNSNCKYSVIFRDKIYKLDSRFQMFVEDEEFIMFRGKPRSRYMVNLQLFKEKKEKYDFILKYWKINPNIETDCLNIQTNTFDRMFDQGIGLERTSLFRFVRCVKLYMKKNQLDFENIKVQQYIKNELRVLDIMNTRLSYDIKLWQMTSRKELRYIYRINDEPLRLPEKIKNHIVRPDYIKKDLKKSVIDDDAAMHIRIMLGEYKKKYKHWNIFKKENNELQNVVVQQQGNELQNVVVQQQGNELQNVVVQQQGNEVPWTSLPWVSSGSVNDSNVNNIFLIKTNENIFDFYLFFIKYINEFLSIKQEWFVLIIINIIIISIFYLRKKN